MTNPEPSSLINLDACQLDDVIAAARANDIMRDELYVDWVKRGKQGPNPDDLPRHLLDKSYAEMIARQKADAVLATPMVTR